MTRSDMHEFGRAPAPVAELMAPRSVAVIGASEDQTKFGGRLYRMLLKHGYAGTVYPINPNRAELLRRDQPRKPRGAVLLAGARGRHAPPRSHRPRQPERRADGDALRPRGLARHRLLPLRVGRQSGRPRDLRLRRVFS